MMRAPRVDPRHIRWLAIGTVLFSLASVLVASWQQDWTFDEQEHLFYARQIVAGQPPSRDSVFNSKTPAMLPNVFLETVASALGVQDPARLRFIARLPSVGVFAALLAAVFFFTRQQATALAAWVAVLACSLDPSLVAHSGLTSVDAIFALACFLTLWAMVAFVRADDWKTTTLLGLALGLSLAVKFTGLYLLPAFLALPFLSENTARPEVIRRYGRLTAAVLLACLVVSASYFFLDFGKSLSEFPFKTAPFKSLAGTLGWLRLPLPGEFLTGIDMVVYIERNRTYNVVILDRWYDYGTWYYFFVLGLLKTPLALLAGCAAAFWVGIHSGTHRHPGMGLILFQSLLFIVYFSFLFRAQIGYRYVLMLLPLAYAFAAICVRRELERPAARYAVVGLAVFALLELVPFFGHPLAFTNSLVLPKREAYRYVADSSLYWNQFNAQMPDLVHKAGLRAAINPFHIVPGTVVFDGNTLSGVMKNFEQHRWVRQHLRPKAHIRHVLFVYEVSPAEFDRFMAANRTYAPPQTPRPCNGRAEVSPIIAITGLQVLCVEALEASDVSLAVLSGSAQAGFMSADGLCQPEPLNRSTAPWYRLKKGRHAFCVTTREEFRFQWKTRTGDARFLVPNAP